jgi:hypothetical protein
MTERCANCSQLISSPDLSWPSADGSPLCQQCWEAVCWGPYPELSPAEQLQVLDEEEVAHDLS